MVKDRLSYIAKIVGKWCRAKCPRSNYPSIVQDIVFAILIRLPAKSLMRFKLVCKSWKLLISDPVFVDSHLYQQRKIDPSPSPLILVLGQEDNKRPVTFYTIQNHVEDGYSSIRSLWTKFLPYDESVSWFPQHYDGLLVFSTQRHICVCNPTTREFVLLPPNSDPSTERYFAAKSVGLGFDRSIKKYKVVRIFYRYRGPPNLFDCNMLVEVFTLGTGSKSWTKIKEVPPYSFPKLFDMPASVGGGVYWKLDNKILQDSSRKAILRFDVTSEKFSSVDLPPALQDLYIFRMDAKITEFQGSLCCMHYRPDSLHTAIQMWMTKDFDKDHAWTLSSKLIINQNLYGEVIPISLHQGGSWIVRKKNGLFYYNTRTGLKELKVYRDPLDPLSVVSLSINHHAYNMTQYVENIVSICA